MFVATQDEHEVSTENDVFEVEKISDVLTSNGYVNVKNIKVGDIICGKDFEYTVKNILQKEKSVLLYI